MTATSYNVTPEEQKTTSLAIALHAALEAVDLEKVPVMSTDRMTPRKQQARLARELFRKLGLKGISVTTPNYSMAQTVDVRLPRRRDFTMIDEHGFIENTRDPAAIANRKARESMLAILMAAFPQHDDRSDSMTDYFDSCWSF